MTVSVGDTLKIVASMVYPDAGINQNVFNARIGGAGGPYADADIVDDAVAWLDNMYANLTTKLSDELDGSQCQVYVYDPINDDWDEVGAASWGFTPTKVDSYIPRGVAALINLRTTDPDVQGKKYIPGTTEADISDGLYIASLITQVLLFGVDWYTAFAGGTSGASWVPGVWSVVGKVLLDAVADTEAPNIPAYQRRRKRGIGI